jgi:hypothetical protein
MSYRPYPNAERALKQIDRHYPPAPVIHLECLRPMAESFAKLRTDTQRAARQGFGAGIYVLSTRRLSVVSGGA